MSPTGEQILVPENILEDDQSFELSEVLQANAHYFEHGYVVFRDVISKALCDQVMLSYERQVKQFAGPITRISGAFEPNRVNGNGHIVNALMNVQSAPTGRFDAYKTDMLATLTNSGIKEFLVPILGTNIRLLTTNHFEANPETIPHHDCYFWGRTKPGDIIGAWVALEDIAPGAGRLYVYPGSHLVDMEEYAQTQGQTLAKFHPSDPEYRKLVVNFLEKGNLLCKAPCLRKGDVIFWDSRTIHGSLRTTDPSRSRASFTSHYSAESFALLDKSLPTVELNGILVSCPQYPSQADYLKSRARAKFPAAYQLAKGLLEKFRRN